MSAQPIPLTASSAPTVMMTIKKSLVQKLAEVYATVGRIPKRGRNEFHKYDYVKEEDIVEAVRTELSSRNVILLPGIVSHEWRELQPNKDGKPRDPVVLVNMTFTFMDGDSGETIERHWLGAGQDSGDKGVYKAMTGGDKYFLLKAFLIPTGDDPERENRAERAERRNQGQSTVKPDKATNQARKAAGKLPDGYVHIVKVIPKSSGNVEWAEVILSTGETMPAREPGCITLAMEVCQGNTPVKVITSRNGKGNLQIDQIQRWQSPEAVENARIDAEVAAKDAANRSHL